MKYRLKLSNLQKLAGSVNILSRKDIRSLPEIDERMEQVTDVLQENQELLKSVESQMREILTAKEALEQYKKLRPVAAALKDAKHSEDYRRAHEGDLVLFRKARDQLKRKYSLNALPKASALSKEYEELSKRRDELYEERSLIRKEYKDLENARYNLCTVLGKEKDLELQR